MTLCIDRILREFSGLLFYLFLAKEVNKMWFTRQGDTSVLSFIFMQIRTKYLLIPAEKCN